jgi:hypothetical protein
MAKSITAMLIGIALSEGAIKSVDDTAETMCRDLRAPNMAGRRSAIFCTCPRVSILGNWKIEMEDAISNEQEALRDDIKTA